MSSSRCSASSSNRFSATYHSPTDQLRELVRISVLTVARYQAHVAVFFQERRYLTGARAADVKQRRDARRGEDGGDRPARNRGGRVRRRDRRESGDFRDRRDDGLGPSVVSARTGPSRSRRSPTSSHTWRSTGCDAATDPWCRVPGPAKSMIRLAIDSGGPGKIPPGRYVDQAPDTEHAAPVTPPATVTCRRVHDRPGGSPGDRRRQA